MRQNAMFMVLSDKAANNHLVILDKIALTEFKTKVFNNILLNLETKVFLPLNPTSAADKTVADSKKKIVAKAEKTKIKPTAKKRSFLIIVPERDEKLNYSARNLPGVELININNINIVDLLKYKNLIITKAVVEKLEERYK